MTKTIVYIDVDGVINSFNESRKLTGWEGEWNLAIVERYKIHWYTDLVESLNELSKREDVEFKWLTTWQDKAVTALCPPLGIEGQYWDVLYHDESEGDHLFSRNNGWWKLKAIIRDFVLHKPDKVIWIDDDFKYENIAIEWAAGMDCVHAVSPDGDLGMTKEEFNGIIEYIDA